MKVTPSDETATYYCGIHSEASLLGIPTATLLRQIASLDDLDERLHTGTEEFTIAETLTPVTSYKIVVAGYDGKEFTGDIALSEAFAVEPPAGPAAFTFEVKEKSFDNTVIDITPLAAEVPYFAEVKEAAVCDAMTDARLSPRYSISTAPWPNGSPTRALRPLRRAATSARSSPAPTTMCWHSAMPTERLRPN